VNPRAGTDVCGEHKFPCIHRVSSPTPSSQYRLRHRTVGGETAIWKQIRKAFVSNLWCNECFGSDRRSGQQYLLCCKSYCSTVHFRRITSIYQPTNAHIISHKTLLKHFKTLRHISFLSYHHQEALFHAKVIWQYSQFNSYLQMRSCGNTSRFVGMCCGAVRRTPSHCSTAHSHKTWCVATIPHLQIRIELWIL